MELTIHIPDDILESVKDKLPPAEAGVLEAIALGAVQNQHRTRLRRIHLARLV